MGSIYTLCITITHNIAMENNMKNIIIPVILSVLLVVSVSFAQQGPAYRVQMNEKLQGQVYKQPLPQGQMVVPGRMMGRYQQKGQVVSGKAMQQHVYFVCPRELTEEERIELQSQLSTPQPIPKGNYLIVPLIQGQLQQ